jgi:hypothetical protein
MVEQRLALIKLEIERRTPESANFISGGKPDAFQTSIFDRTSSSSETGPDTPLDLKLISAGSSWSLDQGVVKHESPTSMINYPSDFRQPLQDRQVAVNKFPPLPDPEDPGYDSDHEGTEMAMQPSQRTIVGDPKSPISPGGVWETVKPRRPKVRPGGKLDLQHHRTTRTLERHRYSDSAGAFRVMNPPDPRAINPHLSHISAERFENTPSRDPSRGRNPGKSNAQVALEHISNSPPPTREGVMSAHRKSLSRGSNGNRMISGISSYAAAVLSSSKDSASSYRQPTPTASEQIEHSTDSASSFGTSPRSSAMEALRHFPIETTQPTSPRTLPPNYTPMPPMPPYPQTPTKEYDQPILGAPYPTSDSSASNRANISTARDPSNIYPRNTRPIPFESIHSASSSPPTQTPPHLSLSSPDIRFSQNTTYIPGHPELSHPANNGYTSQPMSRDPSGQTSHSAPAPETQRRRPSLAETEPMPLLRDFSPRIAPTSYQVYELMRESEHFVRGTSLERGLEGSAERGAKGTRGSSLERGMLGRRASPRTGFARVGDEWGLGSDEK